MVPLVEIPDIVQHYAPFFASVFSPRRLAPSVFSLARAARSSPAEVTSLSNGGAGHKRAFGVPIRKAWTCG